MKPLMTLKEAAEETPFSPKQLKDAINQTDPNAYPPPLKGKGEHNKNGTLRRYLVRDVDLIAWLDSLPDA